MVFVLSRVVVRWVHGCCSDVPRQVIILDVLECLCV